MTFKRLALAAAIAVAALATPAPAAPAADDLPRQWDPHTVAAKLLASAPPAPAPDFPHAVLLDELEGRPAPW